MQVYKPLKDFIAIGGKRYNINASFDNLLKAQAVLKSKKIDSYFKTIMAFVFMFGEIDLRSKYPDSTEIDMFHQEFMALGFHELEPEILQQAFEEVLRRYGGRANDGQLYDITGEPMPQAMIESGNRLFDIDQDGEALYASFMMAYGIDLFEQQGKLHYSQFKAMLDNLPNDTPLGQIFEIRSWSPEKDKRKREEVMRELQNRYKLRGGEVDE